MPSRTRAFASALWLLAGAGFLWLAYEIQAYGRGLNSIVETGAGLYFLIVMAFALLAALAAVVTVVVGVLTLRPRR